MLFLNSSGRPPPQDLWYSSARDSFDLYTYCTAGGTGKDTNGEEHTLAVKGCHATYNESYSMRVTRTSVPDHIDKLSQLGKIR